MAAQRSWEDLGIDLALGPQCLRCGVPLREGERWECNDCDPPVGRAPPVRLILSRDLPSTIRTDKEQTMTQNTNDQTDQTAAADPQPAITPEALSPEVIDAVAARVTDRLFLQTEDARRQAEAIENDKAATAHNNNDSGKPYKIPILNPSTFELMGYVWADGNGNEVEPPEGES